MIKKFFIFFFVPLLISFSNASEIDGIVVNEENVEVVGENSVDENKKNTQSEAREKILNEFKEKLMQNTKNVEKTRIESIDDDFAIIIEKRNRDRLKKEALKNKENLDENILELATKPISEEKAEEIKETQEKYVNLIKNEIKKQENVQEEQIKKINEEIEKEIKMEISQRKNNDNKKQNKEVKKEVKTNKIEKDNIDNTINDNKNVYAIEDKNDNGKDSEIFDITDTGVNREIIYSKKFEKFIDSYKITLVKESNDAPNVNLIVPQEKHINNFKTDNIPDELLSDVRSAENRHIPHILTMGDFQNTARQAINVGDLDTIRGIVRLTKNPNYILNNGETLLNYATSINNLEISRYLVFNGANLNIQNLLGNTALHNAILKNNLEIVKLLVMNNANLEIFNVDGYTPLMLSIIEGRHDITLFLLKFNQNLLLKNYKQETVLDIATMYNRIIIKELILEIISEENQ